MKRGLCLVLVALLLLGLSGCGAFDALLRWATADPIKDLCAPVGLDVKQAQVLSDTDSHGGFHGDGVRLAVLRFPEGGAGAVAESMAASGDWISLEETDRPETQVFTALVYGAELDGTHVGPMIPYDKGSPRIPEVTHGYFLLIDRFREKEQPGSLSMLYRGALNFTLAVYDLDSDTLYFCKVDT